MVNAYDHCLRLHHSRRNQSFPLSYAHDTRKMCFAIIGDGMKFYSASCWIPAQVAATDTTCRQDANAESLTG
ncbi:hypothetical protein IF2G_07135 [Cordyceps javanica]|nr:hypothetical protein IF2G_07135 [Cordyceps javanica]